MRAPIEPPATPWSFPSPDTATDDGLVCIGGDLAPGTILAAYRQGMFPMPVPTSSRRRRESALGWWSPDPRGVIPLDGLKISRSTRRSAKSFDVRIDTAFEEVVRACADASRPHGWINDEIVAAYSELHRAGWAHSVETWCAGELVGGLYGLGIGRFFAGESMFHRATDASKVALVALVDILRSTGVTLLDVQWCTAHLSSLGAVEMRRHEYLAALGEAVTGPTTSWADRTTAHVQGLPYTAGMRTTEFADPGAGAS